MTLLRKRRMTTRTVVRTAVMRVERRTALVPTLLAPQPKTLGVMPPVPPLTAARVTAARRRRTPSHPPALQQTWAHHR